MSPRQEVVERKLAAVLQYVDELRPLVAADLSAYRRDATVRRAVERLLQLCVEASADACAVLAATAGAPPATDRRGEFEAAAQLGAVPPALAARMQRAVGMRHRIVHDYERLDDGLVWRAARAALVDLPEFVAALTRHLARGDTP